MMALIRHVLVYTGHSPYSIFPGSAERLARMYDHLNVERKYDSKPPWSIHFVSGRNLIKTLSYHSPQSTHLVIPAGQSTSLDESFSKEENTYIKEEFCSKGGRIHLTCGSAYWGADRAYNDTKVKTSKIGLFHGIAVGPHIRHPEKIRFTQAINITDGQNSCGVWINGGGSFKPYLDTKQKIQVLARYLPNHENAVIMAQIGKGAALLSGPHPEYGSEDINITTHSKTFPETNWREVQKNLTPLHMRMQFVYKSMILPLECMDF